MTGVHGTDAIMEPVFQKDLSHLTWEQVYERQALRAPLVPAWLDALALKPDARLLDIGAGPGYVSLILAEHLRVGGTVYALDRSEAALAALEQRRDAAGLRNLVTVCGDAATYAAPGHPFDGALLTMVLHHADAPQAILANCTRLLRPGAPLVIAEFAPDGPCESGPPRDHRIEPKILARWCVEAGLTSEAAIRQSSEHYMIIARNCRPG